jgi:hypothetical protein
MASSKASKAERAAYQKRISEFAIKILDCWTESGSVMPGLAAGYVLYSGIVQTELDLINSSLAERFGDNQELQRACVACLCALTARQLVASAAE